MPLTGVSSVKRLREIQQEPHISSTSNSIGAEEMPIGSETEIIQIDQNENPMLNPVALSTLFGYVRRNDLKACRLVCKMWHKVTLPFVRDTFRITVHDIDNSTVKTRQRTRDYGYLPSEENCITSFVKLMSTNTLGIPFARYDWDWVDMPNTQTDRRLFLKLCGNYVKEICMESGKIEHVAELLMETPNIEKFEMPYWLNKPMFSKRRGKAKLFPDRLNPKPKLTRLTTVIITDQFEETKTICPTFFEELFGIAPNIMKISMDDADCASTLNILKVIESTGRESSIKHLSFPVIFVSHVEVMSRMIRKENGLKLESLLIKECALRRGELDWLRLVELCRNDLVDLFVGDIYFTPDEPAITTIEFPQMKKLKALDFHLTSNIRVLSNNFKNNFPVLEKLVMSSSSRNLDNLFTGDESSSSMKSLNLERVTINMEQFERILFICPSLKKIQLKITVDCENILRKIWTDLTQLEELELRIMNTTEINLDSLVTGIPIIECQKIVQEKNYHWRRLAFSVSKETRANYISGVVDAFRVESSIANLTNLRRFTIAFPDLGHQLYSQGICISDITGYLGLYFLKKLKHLRILYCQVSKSCCQTLIEDMELESWDFIWCGQDFGKTHCVVPQKYYPYSYD